MRYVTLTSINDPQTGELGLKVEGVPAIDYPMAANEGFLIAHDLLEHQQGLHKIGTIGDELLALGGVWYVRGQHGDISRNGVGSFHSAESNVASDVSNMGCMYVANEHVRLHIKPPSRLPPCLADEDIAGIAELGRQGTIEELRCQEDRIDYARLDKYTTLSERLMRRGYNMARRRFERGHSRYYANSMFWNIADAVDPYCKNIDFEGRRFRLSYGDYEAHCKEIHDEEEYY